MIKTDSAGRFSTSVDREGAYLIYVTYDDERTPGVDYVPERWRTWLSLDSVSSREFVLKKGASIYLDGDARHVEVNRPATSYQFIVLELKGGGGDYWTGPVRDYGSFSHLVQFLGFDERLVVVPAETEVKIQITANFPYGKSQTFNATGKIGYFKLLQGENLRIDIREHSVISNIRYVKEMLNSGFSLLDECRTAGFLVEAESEDLYNAYYSIEESFFLWKKGLFDQSFAKARSAYILADRSEKTLRGLIESSLNSLVPTLILFLIVALASSRLVTEGSNLLEITTRNGSFGVSITFFLETIFYFLLFISYYFIFPGCHLVHRLTYISMGIFVFLFGKATTFLFPKFARETRSEDQPIQLKSAIVVAFLMGSRNLHRRKVRTLMNLISIMIFVFGFITLTSISPRYGLSIVATKSVLPVDALLVEDAPLGGAPGEFIQLPESFLEWLESNPNVTIFSPKAENTPVYLDDPLGRLYSTRGEWRDVLGVIGIIPSGEANLTGLNQIVMEGEYLRDDDHNGILVSSSWKENLKVDVGDKLYGFGQEFIIRGFFDKESLSKFLDIDGEIYLPYCKDPDPQNPVENLPCPPDSVIILTYDEALTLPKVSTSRVAVQLSDIERYDPLARMIALIYEYRVYISHPRFLTTYYLGEYLEEKGTALILPLMALVMLNIGLSMFANVNERRNEIANLSSVGLNPAHIAALFIAEAMIIGFIGGGFGYLLGILGYRLAFLIGELQVREKVSAEWGVLTIFISVLTAVIASLIPALRSSTIMTPSLARQWSIEEEERPKASGRHWVLNLPIVLLSKEIEPFTAFMIKRLRRDEPSFVGDIYFDEEPEGDILRKISFDYYLPRMGGRTRNSLLIQKGAEGTCKLKLMCIAEGSSISQREAVHLTATYVRKVVLEWSTSGCEVAVPFDPHLGILYNLISTYSPTTLYLISTYLDTHEKIEALRKALILRGIRPPKFTVSIVDPLNLNQIMKAAKSVVSEADIVCISGENPSICSALAMESVKQKKTICYVIDNRPVEERERKPFQELKIVTLS